MYAPKYFPEATFINSQEEKERITYPSMRKINIVDPTLCYFEGRLTPMQEASEAVCKDYNRWQHWCLRQTRNYEV